MEEQLITFETAKLAKEKGFDINCKNKFVETLEHTLEMGRGGDFTFPHQPPRILSHHGYDKWQIVHCSAPTQSLLQKWLREIHEIDISVIFNYDLRCYNCEVVKWIDGVCNINNSYGFDKFEEGLEFGLQEALKLIKT